MKNLSFALIHVECCNQNRNTPCRIALVGVNNSQITEKSEILIEPQHDAFDYMSSGITYKELKGKGDLISHWDNIYNFISKYPVLLSASDGYDSDVLFNAIQKNGIKCEPIPYLTAKNILRKSISTFSYSFGFVCQLLGVVSESKLPLDVATNWCELVVKSLQGNDAKNLIEFAQDNNVIVGEISSSEYKRCHIKPSKKVKANKDYDESKFLPDHPFYGMNVVFTGTLNYFLRDDAQDHVSYIGGCIKREVNKSTNYLIVGVQNPSQIGADGLSGKMRKAIKYKEEGCDIEILSEMEFVEIMGLEHVVESQKDMNERLDQMFNLK